MKLDIFSNETILLIKYAQFSEILIKIPLDKIYN